jgi:hypothetical protein
MPQSLAVRTQRVDAIVLAFHSLIPDQEDHDEEEKISPKAASARALDLLSGWTAAKKEKEDHTAAVQEEGCRQFLEIGHPSLLFRLVLQSPLG